MRAGVLLSLAVLLAGPAMAGGRPAPAGDLTGMWTSISLTTLERPPAFAALTVSDTEAAVYEKKRPDEFATTDIDDIGGRQTEAGFWDVGVKLARIDGKARTSWIVEPADGHLPFSPAGLAQRAKEQAAHNDSANPETRTASEQCLLTGWAGAGPPMLNAPYANQYAFVQTKEAVAIVLEAVHDVRVVRLVSGPADVRHLPAALTPWLGDSVGWWEGRTLVVETTNFNPGDALKMPTTLYVSPAAKVVERFTRNGPEELRYDFSVEDPAVFSRPWKAEMVFHAAKGPMLEYACHEGNRGLEGILAGARHEERQASGR